MADVRLLACVTCKVIEVLGDYTGPQSEASRHDHELNLYVGRHSFTDGRGHIAGGLYRVKEDEWRLPGAQEQVTEQINNRLNGGETGFGTAFYQLKETFKDDAMTCWKEHGRRVNCEDFRSDRKRLVPDTNKERKELGMASARSNIFLCNYCPVNSLVEQAIRKKNLKD